MGQLMMADWERESMVREFKNDPTIEMYRKILYKINCLAKPHIVICPSNPELSVFGIDEESQSQIDYWTGKMNEYILGKYSDILTTNS